MATRAHIDHSHSTTTAHQCTSSSYNHQAATVHQDTCSVAYDDVKPEETDRREPCTDPVAMNPMPINVHHTTLVQQTHHWGLRPDGQLQHS